MKITDIKDRNSLQNAAEVLKRKRGGILVFPTDTVYGIGCILNEKTIKRLYKIKNRPLSQPTAVLISNKLYHSTCSSINMRIKEFLSGEVTLILEKNKIDFEFPKILIKDDKVGIRIPNHKWLEELIDKVGPIVASSANIKGEPAPRSFDEISKQIIEEANLVIRIKGRLSGVSSTVYDTEEDKIIRP